MLRPRTLCLPLLLLSVIACAEDGAAVAVPPQQGDAGPALVAAAGGPAVDPEVPPGHYQCWYWRSVYSPSGFTGELQASAMGWIRLAADGTYQTGLNPSYALEDSRVETDTKGTFTYDASANAFTFTSGWLEGAAASYEVPEDAPPQVVFLEDANMIGDESRIDTNDTKCSFEHD